MTTIAEAPPDEEQNTPPAPVEEPVPTEEPEPVPEEPEAPEGPEEPVQPPGEAVSEADIERGMEKLEREATRHRNRLSEIMGEEAQLLQPCPACDERFAGWRWPVPPEPDELQAILVALGVAEDLEYAESTTAVPCDVCKALGRVLTGSRVAEHRTMLCPACEGAGYRVQATEPQTPPAGEAPQLVAPAPEPAHESPPDVDPWDRPRGHPDFGRLPNYVS